MYRVRTRPVVPLARNVRARRRAMVDGDDDAATLYDDLVDAHGDDARVGDDGIDGRSTREAIGRMNVKVAELEEKLRASEGERAALRARCENLERNMSCLFNTAMLEVERKDKEIARLREERE